LVFDAQVLNARVFESWGFADCPTGVFPRWAPGSILELSRHCNVDWVGSRSERPF